MAKILVVDDDPDFVETTRIVLEQAGYAVVSAASALSRLRPRAIASRRRRKSESGEARPCVETAKGMPAASTSPGAVGARSQWISASSSMSVF